MRRAGFTLVEILVACALGTAILGSAMLIYNLAGKQRGVTATARALQTAMLIEERFTSDIRRLVRVGAGPLKFEEGKPRISFYAHDPTGPKTPVGFRGVVYSLPPLPADKTPQYLQREWDARVDSVGVSPLTSISFKPMVMPTGPAVRVTLTVGRDQSDPEGPALVHTFLVRVPSPNSSTDVEYQQLADFAEPDKDRPTGQRLPAP